MRNHLAIASVVVCLVFSASIGGWNMYESRASPLPFTSEDWRNGDRDVRGRMVASLLAYPGTANPGAQLSRDVPTNSRLFECTHAAVVELLGPPDHRHPNTKETSVSRLKYYLGDRGHWDHGQFVLTVYFDENERVKSFFVGR